jgi:FkbM family methyltransferase
MIGDAAHRTARLTCLSGVAGSVREVMRSKPWLYQCLRPVYESLLDGLSRGRGIRWKINGITYRVDPRQRHRLGQDYDAPVAAFLRERVLPGQTILNIGANVGVYVLQCAYWSRPTGQIVAFEPNPAAREILQKHIHQNGLSSRVRIVAAAVGAKPGRAVLYAADADGMSRIGVPNQAIADKVIPINVPVMTVDEYCYDHQLVPDWLLIDIEGFEIAALSGARELIKASAGRVGIIAEMHPSVWMLSGTNREEAEMLLSGCRLNVVPLTGQSDPLGEHGLVYLAHNEV